MANPLACAVAHASVSLLLSQPWQERVRSIEARLREVLAPLVAHPAVAEVRCLGAIGVLEMHDPVDMRQLIPLFVQEGVWIRPFGRLVYVMPPFGIISDDELDILLTGLKNIIEHYPTNG